MDIVFKKLFMNLLLGILTLLDNIFSIFKQLAGIEPIGVGTQGSETDIMSAFLNSSTITQVFYGILIIAVLLCAISVIVAIVKAFINLSGGERKRISKIAGQGISMVFITMAMAGIMVSGIAFANVLLKDVHNTFGGQDTKISSEVFDASVEGSIEYRYKYDDPLTLDVTETYDNPVWLVDGDGELVLDEGGNKIRVTFGEEIIEHENGWKDGSMSNDFDVANNTADSIYGVRPKDWVGMFERADASPTGNYLVEINGFNFVTGYFSGVILLIAIAAACLGLVKRLYDIVILFLSLPLIVATVPLDDGARFKVWRETVVSKVILAYGAVFAVNVFLLMVPVIQTFAIDSIFKMLLMVGGGLCISGGTLLFARLFGTDAAEGRDLAQSARTLMAGTVATAGLAGGVVMTAGKITTPIRTPLGKGLKGLANKLDFRGAMSSLGGSAQSGLAGSKTYTGSNGISAPAAAGLSNALSKAGTKGAVFTLRDSNTGRFMKGGGALSKLTGGSK